MELIKNKDENIIEFYAAVYNQKSRLRLENSKQVIEIINKGAFDNVVDNNYVIANILHDNTNEFGNTNSNLTLVSDDYGLKATVKLTDDEYSRVSKLLDDMDINESSFKAESNDYSEKIEGDITYRYINTISKLIDVSLVTTARYKNTIILQRNDETMDETVKTEDKEKEIEQVETEKEIENKDKPVEYDKKEKEDEKPEQETKENDKPVENKNKESDSKEKEIELERNTDKEINNINKEDNNNKMEKSYLELIREAASNDNGGTITLERAGETTTTTSANAIDKKVGELSISGKELVWEKLGADFHRNAVGTIMLPYKSAAVGQKVAELAAITKDTISPQGNLLSPKRYGYTFEISVETLASAGDSYFQKLVEDGQKGAYRAFEKSVYEKLIAGAGEVAGTDLTVDGMTALEGEIDSDGEVTFVSSKKTFFKLLATAVDAGSGIMLAKKTDKNEGELWNGGSYLFSTNFVNPSNEEYVIAGDFANGLAIADWNKTEVIFDKFTRAKEGIIEVTVNLLMDSALKNPLVVKRTVDLDANP